MGIKSARLKNFGPHADLEVIFERVTRIVGPNAGGKSYIKDAIEFAFAGKARGLTHKNERGALLRDGAKTGSVNLKIKANGNHGTLTRTCAGKANWPEDVIADVAGDPRLAHLLADSLRIIKLPARARESDDRQKVFAAYASKGEVDLAKYIAERLHAKLDEFRGLGLEPMGLVSAAANDIDAAIKLAIQARRKAKASANALENLKPSPIPMVRNSKGQEMSADKAPKGKIEEGLTTVQAERDKLVGEIKVLKDIDPKAIEAEIAECKTVVEQGAEAENALPDVEKELKSLGEKVKRRADKLMKLTEDKAKAIGFSAADQQTIKDFNPTADATPCVGFREKECPLGVKGQTEIIQSLKGRVSEAAKTIKDLAKEADETRGEIATLNKAFNEADTQASELRTQLSRGVQAIEEIAHLEGQKAQRAGLPAKQEEKTALDDRITRGQQLLQTINGYQAALRQHQSDRAAHETYLKAADLWDHLEKLLSGDGRAYMAEAAKGAVMPASLMKAWGIDVEITSEGDVYYTDERNKRPRRPVQMCSNSEQLRAGVVLTACLAVNSGKKWMIVDEANLLDDAAMDALLVWATEQKALDTLLIIGTSDQPITERAGMRLYAL